MKKRYVSFTKNWRHSSLVTAFAISCALNVQAQTAPAKLWDKTFGGSYYDNLICAKQTSDGGYILGGHSESIISGDKSQTSQGGFDYWVIKTDANGNKVWDKTFGASGSENIRFVQQTADGGYILAGVSNSGLGGDKSQASKGLEDYWIVKIDATGIKQWDKGFGGPAEDEIYSIQQTADGGYILGGSSKSGIGGDKTQINQGDYDFWVVKLDGSGNKTWDKTFGGSASDLLYSLRQTADGGYILGGSSKSGISGDKTQASNGLSDYWVIKIDGSGNKTWDKAYGGSGEDVNVYAIQQTTDGGYVFAGTSASVISGDKTEAPKGGNDFWIIKTDAAGVKTWDKTFGGSSGETMRTMQQTADGGFVMGGFSNSGISGDKTEASKGGNDFWVIKLNTTGGKSWDKTLGATNPDNLNSMHQTSDGGFILGGMSGSSQNGDKSQVSKGGPEDFWVVRLAAQVASTPIDMGVSTINGVTSGCTLTSQETITITVNNHGSTPQSNIPVSYKINNGTPVNEILAGPVSPNASASYSFTTKANLSTAGTYAIEARADMAGDAMPANDLATLSVTNYAVPATPTVTVNGSASLCTGNVVTLNAFSGTPGISYQWYMNGNAIIGATTNAYLATVSGNYTSTAIIGGSCSSPASNAITLTLYTTPQAPVVNATGPLTICSGDSVALIATSSVPGTTFSWYKSGVLVSGTTNGTYMAKLAGNYTATAISNGCESPFSLAHTVTVKSLPATPTVTQSGMVLTSSSTTGNQWYMNNVIISGATARTYNVTSNGIYTVRVTANSCDSETSNAVTIANTGISDNEAVLNLSVYPNPSNGIFSIELPQGKGYEMTVTDLTGKVVKQLTANGKDFRLNLNGAAKGIYLLKIVGEGKTAVHKLAVE